MPQVHSFWDTVEKMHILSVQKKPCMYVHVYHDCASMDLSLAQNTDQVEEIINLYLCTSAWNQRLCCSVRVEYSHLPWAVVDISSSFSLPGASGGEVMMTGGNPHVRENCAGIATWNKWQFKERQLDRQFRVICVNTLPGFDLMKLCLLKEQGGVNLCWKYLPD